jgi:hypothetical protein
MHSTLLPPRHAPAASADGRAASSLLHGARSVQNVPQLNGEYVVRPSNHLPFHLMLCRLAALRAVKIPRTPQ